MLDESARLEVELEAVVVVVDEDEVELDVSEPVELLDVDVLVGGGGGGGPSIMPNSPIEPKLDEAEVVPVVEPRLDSSCCIRLSMLLDMSARLEVVEAELVDEVDELPLMPPIPPMPPGGGGGMLPLSWLLLPESLCICSRPDIVPDDRLLRK